MTGVLRRGVAALLVLFLGWQTTTALVDLFREVTFDKLADRRWALVATEAERIDAALGSWCEIHWAIAEHVPEESLIVFLIGGDRSAFDAFYQIGVLGYPRRSVPVLRAMSPSEIAAAARAARPIIRPIFVVDMQSGFPLAPDLEGVAEGDHFTMWRVR